jgi:hypothetical protein
MRATFQLTKCVVLGQARNHHAESFTIFCNLCQGVRQGVCVRECVCSAAHAHACLCMSAVLACMCVCVFVRAAVHAHARMRVLEVLMYCLLSLAQDLIATLK